MDTARSGAGNGTIYTEWMDPRIRTRIVTAVFVALLALVVIGSILKH